MRLLAVVLFSFLSLSLSLAGQAQSKLPSISFVEHGLTFADANLRYTSSNEGTKTDTLRDQLIVQTLAKILLDNPELQVEIGGHVAMNEMVGLGEERAALIKKKLVEFGVDAERMLVVNHGDSKPVILPEVVLGLPTPTEKEAANRKNRRVEIHVISNAYETDEE